MSAGTLPAGFSAGALQSGREGEGKVKLLNKNLASVSHQKRKNGKVFHGVTKVEGVHHFKLFLKKLKMS